MILNADAVRSILLFIQDNLDYIDKDSDCPNEHKEMTHIQIATHKNFDKYDNQEMSYALELLIKERYVSCIGNPLYDSNDNLLFARINGLEWKGQDLLHDIYDDTIWETTKKRASKVGKVSISALDCGARALATAWMADSNAVENLVQGVNNYIK